MRPTEMPHQRLRSRQADQSIRRELRPRPLLRGPILDAPRRRRIDREHGHFCAFQGGDDAAEWVADFAGETEAEDGVDYVVGAGEGGGEVVGEGDGEGAQLGCEAGVDVLLGGYRVEDGWVVTEVVEVSRCD